MQRRWFLRTLWLAAAGAVLAERQPSAAPALELVVIVHPSNRTAVTAGLLEDIFLRRQTQWPDGDRVIPLSAPPDAERRQAFDRAVLRMSPDEVARYWLDQRIRGAGASPREVAEPVLALKLITRLKAAIGYVPAGAELDGARIVARVRDGKLIVP